MAVAAIMHSSALANVHRHTRNSIYENYSRESARASHISEPQSATRMRCWNASVCVCVC